jgi:hypothetical protein
MGMEGTCSPPTRSQANLKYGLSDECEGLSPCSSASISMRLLSQPEGARNLSTKCNALEAFFQAPYLEKVDNIGSNLR